MKSGHSPLPLFNVALSTFAPLPPCSMLQFPFQKIFGSVFEQHCIRMKPLCNIEQGVRGAGDRISLSTIVVSKPYVLAQGACTTTRKSHTKQPFLSARAPSNKRMLMERATPRVEIEKVGTPSASQKLPTAEPVNYNNASYMST